MSSQVIGSGLASLGAMIFFYYSTWIFIIVLFTQPFLDTTHWLQPFFLDKKWAILIPQFLLASGVSLLLLLATLTIFCPRKAKTS